MSLPLSAIMQVYALRFHLCTPVVTATLGLFVSVSLHPNEVLKSMLKVKVLKYELNELNKTVCKPVCMTLL